MQFALIWKFAVGVVTNWPAVQKLGEAFTKMLNKFTRGPSKSEQIAGLVGEVAQIQQRLDTALAQRDHWRRENQDSMERLNLALRECEILEDERVACMDAKERLEWVARSLASIQCNWTSPDAWTVTTYDMHAMETGQYSADTLAEAIDKARLQTP